MNFAQFLEESLLAEAKVNDKFAIAVLLLLNSSKDLAAYGLKSTYSNTVKLSDTVFKKRASNIADTKAPRGASSVSFESLLTAVLGKEVYIDDTDVIIDDKKVVTMEADATWAEVIKSVPGLKAKLKDFYDSIKDNKIVDDIKV